MADSKRQKLVDAIVARMQTISVANGYKTELGANVYDWRVDFDQDELPALSVCDLIADNDWDNPNSRRQIRIMPVQLRIFTRSDTLASAVREYMDDVERAIRQDDRWTVSNVALAMHTRPMRDGFLIPEGQFEIVGAIVEVEITFITEKFNTES